MRIFAAAIASVATLSAAPGAIAATQPGYLNMVIASPPDPNAKVPVFDAIPGADVGTLAVAFPQAVLQHGNVYIYWISFHDLTFNGTCTMSYDITQKIGTTTKKLQGGTILKFACSSPGIFGAGIAGKPLVNSPGLATLTGTVAFGSTKEKLSTTILIQ
jgi:hypothetical protein